MTTEPVAREEAERRAIAIAERTIREIEGDGDPPPTMTVPVPAWIRYYQQEVDDPRSDFGKGYLYPFNHFDRLMDLYVNNEDNFYDAIKQNPEICSVIFPGAGGNIQIFHHLTAELYGSSVVVGVDGFGSTGSVKIIKPANLIEGIKVPSSNEDTKVPSIKEMLEQKFSDMTLSTVENVEDLDVDTAGELINGHPKAYLLHPIHLLLLHEAVGGSAEDMQQTIIANTKKAYENKAWYFRSQESFEEAMEEVYGILIYLWACHNKLLTVSTSKDSRKRSIRRPFVTSKTTSSIRFSTLFT